MNYYDSCGSRVVVWKATARSLSEQPPSCAISVEETAFFSCFVSKDLRSPVGGRGAVAMERILFYLHVSR